MRTFTLLLVFVFCSSAFALAQLPWHQVHGNPTQYDYYRITSDSTYVYACVTDLYTNRLFRSANQGAPGSWTEITTDPEDNAGTGYMIYASGGNLFMLEVGCFFGRLFRSTDHGTTWTIPDPSFGVQWTPLDLEFLPGNTLIAKGTDNSNKALYRSVNSGLSWSKVLIFSGGVTTSFLTRNDTTFLLADTSAYITVDTGATWIKLPTTLPKYNNTILLSDGSFLMMASTGLYTSYDAITWTPRMSPSLPGWAGFATQLLRSQFSDTLFMVGNNSSNMQRVYMSANAGLSWAPYDAGLVTHPQANQAYPVVFLHQNPTGYLFGGVQKGGIFRTGPGETSASSIQSSPETSVSFHPNPATNTLNVWSHFTAGGKAIISIIDVAGRVVQENPVNTTAGSNSHTINVSALPPGVYSLTIASEQSERQARFLKR